MDMDKIIRRIHQLPAREQREMLDLISAIEKQKQVEGARKSFMGFTKAVWPDFIEGNHHKKMAECFDRIISGDLKRLIICMPPRHRLALDTEIPTVSGWKTIQEIKKGDYVFDTYGKPTLVMGKSEIYKEQLYEVEANDGSKVKCDASHLWTVRFHGGHFQTYSTEMLYRRQCGENVVINHGVEKIRAGKACSRPPMLPVNQAVEYPEKELPIDPYVLGVWIGDGSSYGGTITSHDDDQKVLRPEIERRGFVTKDRATRQSFGVDDLLRRLTALNLIKNKHIPEMYLTSSIKQRMDLLRGLMDTDGNVAKGGQCFFAQKKKHIIDKFRELLNSLGIKNFLFASEAKIGDKSYGIHYKVTFYKKDCCFLPRKNIRTKDPVEFNKARTIKVSKTDEFGYVQCLEVANTDGLFQVGRGYLVSHNTKSEFTSHLLPAYYLGHNPKGKIIQASHTADLSIAFGRKTRNLMDTSAYQEIFPDVSIAADAKAAGRWGTNKGGEYYAVGVGGALAGRGANLMIIDDPVSEQDANMALSNPEIYENIYEWYQTGPRQRLQPLGATVICMTRWSQSDLVGKVLKKAQNPDSLDKWEVIEFPAILPSGRPLWPEFWSLESLQATKAALSVPQWNAQYMQAPTSEEGALIKRDWWQLWPEHKKYPKFEAIIQSWDTAFLKTERSNYSACTTWGLFYPDPDSKVPNVLLIDAMKAKLEFPQLKKKAMDLYNEWQPDSVVVEAKAAGAPLIYELRAMGIPIKEFTPSRGQDKIVRVNSITDIFASGMVWRPDTRWAEEVADECAAFPNGESDDIVDTVSQALLLMRQGGWIGSSNDNWDDDSGGEWWKHRKADYY